MAFVEASQEAGHALNDDFNTGELRGTGLADLLIHGGARDSTGNVLDALRASRDNLTVWTEATVRRLVLDGTRCTGVELVRAGETVTAAAEREAVVCAGTIDSPRLLLRSGIGPVDELGQLGIDVVHDLPGVGRNLQDHPMVNVVWSSEQPVPAGTANMAEAVTYLTTSHAREDTPDIQIVFIHVPFHNPWQSGPAHGYTLGVSLMRPLGRGSVRLSSADPDDKPVIDVDYLGQEKDVAALLEGIEKAVEIGGAAAFDPWRGRQVLPSAHDEDTLRAFLRDAVRTYTHIVGTCRMGVGPDAVVDPELRVHGITGLRVADGSIMPSNV